MGSRGTRSPRLRVSTFRTAFTAAAKAIAHFKVVQQMLGRSSAT